MLGSLRGQIILEFGSIINEARYLFRDSRARRLAKSIEILQACKINNGQSWDNHNSGEGRQGTQGQSEKEACLFVKEQQGRVPWIPE